MFYTYILENPDGKLYIGQTSNLDIRVNWHNSGKSKYTKNKGPWNLVFVKEFEMRGEAIKYEKYLKSLKNSAYIKRKFVR